MKRIFQKGASALLALAMAVSPALAASSFPDVAENAAYAQAVDYVSQAGIMVGDDKGNFAPEKTVTRAEMATILCNVLEENQSLTTDGSVFTDVPAQHWANRYVVKAAELGLVSGYGNGKFGPSDKVTYEQAITMIVQMIGLGDIAAEKGGYPDGFIWVASDYGYNKNVKSSKGESLKRWEVATMIYNYMG